MTEFFVSKKTVKTTTTQFSTLFCALYGNKGVFEQIIFPVNERSIYHLYASDSDKKKSYKKIKKIIKGQRIKIDEIVGYRSKIKGTILTPDGIGKQFGIAVQVVGLDNKGNETDYKQVRYSDKEGGFEYDNFPEMNFLNWNQLNV